MRPIDTQAWLRVQAHTLTIRPLAQWKVGDRYVTALGVVNRGPAEVLFDPRALRGDLRFAAALHPRSAPPEAVITAAFWAVVSDQPSIESSIMALPLPSLSLTKTAVLGLAVAVIAGVGVGHLAGTPEGPTRSAKPRDPPPAGVTIRPTPTSCAS